MSDDQSRIVDLVQQETGALRIGKYLLYVYDNALYITIADDGEGGGFPIADFEKVIDKFYQENF